MGSVGEQQNWVCDGSNLGCQSGAVVRSMFVTSAPVTTEVVGSIPGQTHSLIERATLSDSVGFLLGLRFHPTYIVYRATNVIVDAQLSIMDQIFTNEQGFILHTIYMLK
jgi:hypothetical protein